MFKNVLKIQKNFGWVLDFAKRTQSFFKNNSYDMYTRNVLKFCVYAMPIS